MCAVPRRTSQLSVSTLVEVAKGQAGELAIGQEIVNPGNVLSIFGYNSSNRFVIFSGAHHQDDGFQIFLNFQSVRS